MKKWTKAAYHTANILLPLSESARMVRAGRHVASRLAEQTRQLMPVKDDLTDAPELTFDEAITASGLSREVLMRRYLLGKRIWLAMFIVTVAIMLIMPLAFIASDIPATGMLLIRMASLEFMLAAFAGLVFACALKNQYRFWQLQSSHLGTFAEWRRSRRWVIEILSWRKSGTTSLHAPPLRREDIPAPFFGISVMKKLLILLSALALAGFSLPVIADGVNFESISGAATRSTDLSRQLLIMVFGDVVNNPLQPANVSFIGQLYGLFNAIIAGLAFIWFMGITLRATVISGNRGKVFGRGNTMMAPVMSLAGFMALVPTPSGWSISNLAFLWMASIMGVGSANLLTDRAADTIMEGQSLIMQPVAGETITAARGIFDMYLCKSALNTEQAEMHQNSSSSTPPMSVQHSADGREIRITNGSAICGSTRLPETTENSSGFSFSVPINSGPLENAQNTAFTAINDKLSASAEHFVNAWLSYQDGAQSRLPDIESEIQQAARQYEDTINAATSAVNNEGTIRGELANYLKQSGWISLGAWYQSFATANQKINDVAHQSPITTGPSNIGEVGVGRLQEEIKTALLAQRKNSTFTPPLGSANMPGNDNLDDVQSANSALIKVMPKMQQFTAWIANTVMTGGNQDSSEQVNPLLKMKAIGDYTLGIAETTFSAFTIAKTIVDWGNGTGVGKLVNVVSGAGYIAKSVIGSIAPVVYFTLFILLSVGFSLSIFLPFIPLIYWITACTSWLGSVLIGTTAGSLWAATHIGTEEDKGSRANYGYIFLIDAAIRPSLMVFGFFFASLVVVAIGTLLNILILPALANVQADSITGLVSIIGILMIYARICTTLVSSAFSLQVYLPDYVIAWLGGREAAQMMKGAVESARSMFAGFGGKAGHTPGIKKMEQNQSPGNADGFK